MPGVAELFVGYGLETEWLLTWFPTREGSNLSAPRMLGGFFNHQISDFTDPGIGGGVKTGHMLANDFKNLRLAAFIEVGRDANYFYEAQIEVSLGDNRRRKYLQLLPGTTTPFMVNVSAGGNHQETNNTSLVLQGVFTAGQRASVASIFVSGLFGR